jgi:hypothetical protein
MVFQHVSPKHIGGQTMPNAHGFQSQHKIKEKNLGDSQHDHGNSSSPQRPQSYPPSTRDGLVPHYVYEMLVVGGQPTHQTNHYWRGHLQVGKKNTIFFLAKSSSVMYFTYLAVAVAFLAINHLNCLLVY